MIFLAGHFLVIKVISVVVLDGQNINSTTTKAPRVPTTKFRAEAPGSYPLNVFTVFVLLNLYGSHLAKGLHEAAICPFPAILKLHFLDVFFCYYT